MKKTIISILLCVCLIGNIVNAKEDEDILRQIDAVNEPYIDFIRLEEKVYKICPELIETIIWYESRGVSDVRNGGCKGLMQINERYHKDRMNRLYCKNLYEPKQNIVVGIDYLYELFETYEDPSLVLMLYNGQPNAMQKYENGEMTKYASNILELSSSLERLHEGGVESDKSEF